MEKYIKAEMEVVVFETEDVITTSGTGCFEGHAPDSDDSCFGY